MTHSSVRTHVPPLSLLGNASPWGCPWNFSAPSPHPQAPSPPLPGLLPAAQPPPQAQPHSQSKSQLQEIPSSHQLSEGDEQGAQSHGAEGPSGQSMRSVRWEPAMPLSCPAESHRTTSNSHRSSSSNREKPETGMQPIDLPWPKSPSQAQAQAQAPTNGLWGVPQRSQSTSASPPPAAPAAASSKRPCGPYAGVFDRLDRLSQDQKQADQDEGQGQCSRGPVKP